MTPTDRPQKPRECKYHNAKYCEASMYYTNGGKTIVMQPCRLCEPNISHCPTSPLKPRKMGNNDNFDRILKMNTEAFAMRNVSAKLLRA